MNCVVTTMYYNCMKCKYSECYTQGTRASFVLENMCQSFLQKQGKAQKALLELMNFDSISTLPVLQSS